MSDTIQELQAKLSLFENDAAKRGFYTINRIVNQQVEYLNGFNIKSKIGAEDKSEMAEYKNAKDLWENLPKMITSLNQLRLEMNIDGNEESDIPKIIPITPQSIAKQKIN